MDRIRLDVLGQEVSSYCLGTMYFGSKLTPEASMHLMDIYAEAGGNLIDSANKYASWIEGCKGGESEEVIGRWLKGKAREEFVITSKLGFPYQDIPKSLAAKYIISECERSLERLGTEYIDIYFAHTQDEQTPIEESLEAFDRLRQAGKIRAVGASNFNLWRLAEANALAQRTELPPFSLLQQRFTLLQPVVGADFGTQQILTPDHRDYCETHSVVMMGYSPLLGGIYEREGAELPVQYRSEYNEKILALLHKTAQESGYTPSQLVLGWMAHQGVTPEVTASRAEHLLSNLIQPAEEVVAEFAKAVSQVDNFTIKYS